MSDDILSDVDLSEFLAHYGVKGMKWGQIKGYEPTGSAGSGAGDGNTSAQSAEAYSAFGAQVKQDLKDQGVDTDLLKAKYGPQETGAAEGGLTPHQKQLIIKAGVGIVGVAAIAYYAKKSGLSEELSTNFQLFSTRNQVYNSALNAGSNGLDIHWDKGIDLPAGSIFSRVSTIAEKDIRPEGFYAAFEKGDVDRYKAILPTFWQDWGVGDPAGGGFVNNYQAKAAIKAPSGSESISIFKDLISNNKTFREDLGLYSAESAKDFLSNERNTRDLFECHAADWARSYPGATKTYFDAVKARGYNALIDFNDAGALSKTPVRTIDGSMFDIISNEPLQMADMVGAASRVKKTLVHALLDLHTLLGHDRWSEIMHGEGVDPDAFLEHYGKKGMKWGVTTKESRSDYKARVADESLAFNNKKMQDLIATSLKGGDKVLLQTRYQGDTFRTITTGKEFVSELSKGRAFDITVTEVFAKQTKEGPYQLTGEQKQYVKSERRTEDAAAPVKLVAKAGVSSVTKKAIDDHNSLTEPQFQAKYAVSKKTYAKRVEKYGDPYMNSPLAKIGKKLAK